jgi:hypothetical protein
MIKQLFRRNVEPQLLFDLLSKICLKTEKYYFIDLNAFRKMTFHLYHEHFFQELLNHYHTSKQYYITRPLTYNSFTTIIRQICKSNEIMFTSNIHYNQSKYNIDYFVFFDADENSVDCSSNNMCI